MRAQLASARLDLIVNDAKSVTGSVHSFLSLLHDLRLEAGRAKRGHALDSWPTMLRKMNTRAEERAEQRLAIEPSTALGKPERYRLATLCLSQEA